MRAAFLMTFATACSVAPLSLEGKQCPCADGYVCDTLTNRCLATNDGGGIIDTPAATQCIPSGPSEPELYRYMSPFDWNAQAGTWNTDTSGEIQQTSTTTQDAYAYKTAAPLTNAPNQRVIATMRQITNGSGSPTLGVVLRAQLADKSRYTCNWSAKNRMLVLEAHAQGSTTMLGAASISPTATLPTSFTMEAAVDGSVLSCCIRELPDARLMNIPDAAMTLTMGYPGLETSRMSAAFGSFVVFQRP